MGAGITAGIARIARALARALDLIEPPVQILLENTAGQGSCIGHRFEHLAAWNGSGIRTGPACLDTCHLFAAGYDIRTAEGYAETFRQFDRLIGLGNIRAFHVNDSKKELGSRVDRHFHIGQGFIGLDAFRFLSMMNASCRYRKFWKLPKVQALRKTL